MNENKKLLPEYLKIGEGWRAFCPSKAEEYEIADEKLKNLFTKFPTNTDEDEVHKKVKELNKKYGCCIDILLLRDVSKIIIRTTNIDSRLQNGCKCLVDELARKFKDSPEVKRDFYVFSSKYCHFHNPKQYPIHDKHVKNMLIKLMHDNDFSQARGWTKDDQYTESRYQRFADEVMKDFRDFYALNEYSYKQIDIYLWSMGKKLCPKDLYI